MLHDPKVHDLLLSFPEQLFLVKFMSKRKGWSGGLTSFIGFLLGFDRDACWVLEVPVGPLLQGDAVTMGCLESVIGSEVRCVLAVPSLGVKDLASGRCNVPDF
jgi:hypothetical protein